MSVFLERPASSRSISMRRPFLGIGINDADYVTKFFVDGEKFVCPYYTRWQSMMHRCYSPKKETRYPTYDGCSVCDEWLSFSVFKAWMKRQDWDGMELDKDIMVKGNKVYSPETCLFIPRDLNGLLNSGRAARGDYPRGVSFVKRDNKFRAQMKQDGKPTHLGIFNTKEEAGKAYIKAKNKEINRKAIMYPQWSDYIVAHQL
tara:strand:+ start:809 stop:1414 length:606 start_codon:yes stop_codon:yes gene_type:complete